MEHKSKPCLQKEELFMIMQVLLTVTTPAQG